ncbi:hypothetical protein M405DRAFT_824873 [Rhizopogon salebrosus TDB-379]|nr:hypothetical protein M405DRAFT_824873 [Rhizopogon salebrosus TDB-379]
MRLHRSRSPPDDLARLESPAEPQISPSTVYYPSKTLPTTALATAKPSAPWKYTPPPLTNSSFARTLSDDGPWS